MKKIGIFGGTFDPIHFGHLILARDAMEQLHLDSLLFIPAALSPHKLGAKPASADLRAVVNSLQQDGEEVYVTDLGDKATIVIRKRVPRERDTDRAESELRLSVAERLRDAGTNGQ